MSNRPQQDEAAVRYLLGTASEEEKTLLEESLFKNPETLEAVSAAEEELIDDYLSGELARDERDLFEKAYFASPERRARLEFARTLRQRLADKPASSAVIAARRAPRRFPVWLAAASILFGLLAAFLAVDSARIRREIRQLQAEQAAAARREEELSRRAGEARAEEEKLKQELAREHSESERLAHEVENLQSSVRTVSFTLIAGLVRGNGNLQTVRLPPDTVNLRLTAPLTELRHSSYRAVIQTPEGKIAWKGEARRAESGATSVLMTVPAASLASGDYILSVTGITAKGIQEPAADFSFRVKKS
ncbi:MAG TPA: hypothetical protein VEG84_00350 [Thermoanaerobaculia bacterium]|nr:hypothetical protein [Thermoanaerobaculia bacterium]